MGERICSVDDCGRGLFARGLCKSHYRRDREYGDPLAGPPVRRKARDGMTLAEYMAEYTPQGLPDDSCWEWKGNINDTGYGRACYGGQVRNAHRVVAEMTFGKLPRDIVVRHTCDNRRCVNPAHIVTGTQRDNVHDMRWGRSKRRNVKLTEQDVMNMRELYSCGVGTVRLAVMFNLTRSHVWRIVTRRSWRYVP